jgi:hypothetical protein
MATFPSKVNYATGDVLTATNMNDVGGAINLLDGAQYAAGKNLIINGAMDIWQRGTTFTALNGYSADRWYFNNASSATGRTFSRQSAVLTGFNFCQRVQRDVGTTLTGSISIRQNLESISSIPLAGKIATISFYARAGANYSPTSNALVAQLKSGTGTDQNSVNTYTGEVNVINQTATLTTTWQRFSYTGTIATNATELAVVFVSAPVGTAGANDYFEVTGVQLEAASTASPFQTASGTVQGEVALCQRFYFRAGANSGNATSAFSTYGQGFCASITEAFLQVYFPQTMRTNPTAIEYASIAVADSSGTFYNLVSTAFNQINTNSVNLYCYGLAGLTANRPARLANNNNTAGYFAASAEL